MPIAFIYYPILLLLKINKYKIVVIACMVSGICYLMILICPTYNVISSKYFSMVNHFPESVISTHKMIVASS